MDYWKMHALILDEILGTHAYVEVENTKAGLVARVDGELITPDDPFYVKVCEFVQGFNDCLQGRTGMP